MAIIAPAFVTVNPSYVLPELIMQYSQVSGAFELLADGGPLVRLGEGDLWAYAKKVDLRTRVTSAQTAYNQLPSCSIVLSQISTPTYLVRTRAEYDHHDTAAAGKWGVPIVEAHRLAMRQGIYQQARNALLYGFNPTNGEGLLNTQGATATSLPPDTNGNTSVVTYDNGQMAIFILTQINLALQRTYQLGQNAHVSICGPQRVLGAFIIQNIVQVTTYQRPGAGTATTGEIIDTVLKAAGVTVEWAYDDTLQGKGVGGTDAIIITIPEVTRQPRPRNGLPNTNEFAELRPGMSATCTQLFDMVAPREIPTPIAGGAIDVLAEQRMTSGWAFRPEAVTILSMLYQ